MFRFSAEAPVVSFQEYMLSLCFCLVFVWIVLFLSCTKPLASDCGSLHRRQVAQTIPFSAAILFLQPGTCYCVFWLVFHRGSGPCYLTEPSSVPVCLWLSVSLFPFIVFFFFKLIWMIWIARFALLFLLNVNVLAGSGFSLVGFFFLFN